MGILFKWLINKFPSMEWLVVILIYVILFYFGPFSLFRRYKNLKMAIIVDGVIHAYFRGENIAEVRYVFDGQAHSQTVPWVPSILGKDIGKHVKIFINPANINEVYVQQFSASVREWVLTIGWVAGMICMIISVILK